VQNRIDRALLGLPNPELEGKPIVTYRDAPFAATEPTEPKEKAMATPNVPLGSVAGIEGLATFGLQIFLSIFGALRHKTTPLPTAAVPAVTAMLQATPGVTADHQTVIATAAAKALEVHTASA
jgi:hypothetical protein